MHKDKMMFFRGLVDLADAFQHGQACEGVEAGALSDPVFCTCSSQPWNQKPASSLSEHVQC